MKRSPLTTAFSFHSFLLFTHSYFLSFPLNRFLSDPNWDGGGFVLFSVWEVRAGLSGRSGRGVWPPFGPAAGLGGGVSGRGPSRRRSVNRHRENNFSTS